MEYFDLPDDRLPTEELENLLQSIRFEMTNNDWERVKDMETINLEDFKAIMINKVNTPEEMMGARSYGISNQSKIHVACANPFWKGGRFLDNQLFDSNEDSDGSDEPHSRPSLKVSSHNVWYSINI